ncbi:MAG: hypothetical protein IKB94_07755 [Clostridia bacterium]|nr:hypothetical protein [Clostridia bacterium]
MKTKKLLSILLALMMILSVVPFYASAAPIALTVDNIAVWPTFEGEMFYGQKLNEGDLQIVGGVVTLDGTADGTVVAGHFEFTDPEYRPTQMTGNYASMTFVPNETDSYVGFTVTENEKAVYSISKTDPVLKDPVNDPPVAKQIAAGKRVMQATLSGGTLMNPYTKEVIPEGKWAWSSNSRTKVVNESGYYEAGSSVGVGEQKNYYNTVKMYVYVRVEGDTSEQPEAPGQIIVGTVTSWPTIEHPEWTPGMTVADLTLTGGEATVAGAFKIATDATTAIIPNEENRIKVEFTPADSNTSMLGGTNTLRITPVFTPMDITATVDPDFVCTYEYGTKHLGSLSGASAFGITTDLPSNIRANVFVSKAVDKDGNAVDTYNKYLTPGEYTARIAISIPKTELAGVGEIQLYNSPVFIENIPIVITKQKSTGEFASLRKVTDITEGEGQSTANIQYKFSDKSGVDGYCVLKVNGETVVDNIASAETSDYSSYLFTTNTSGKFTATLEYIPAETDYIEFETTVLTQEFELEVLEPEIPVIPGGFDIDDIFGNLGDLTEGDSDNPIENIINNLVAFFKNIINTIKNFFRGIGDLT